MVMCELASNCGRSRPNAIILRPEDWDVWTGASPIEAKALCVPYAGEITSIALELWVRRAITTMRVI
jgi:hypothetical protein